MSNKYILGPHVPWQTPFCPQMHVAVFELLQVVPRIIKMLKLMSCIWAANRYQLAVATLEWTVSPQDTGKNLLCLPKRTAMVLYPITTPLPFSLSFPHSGPLPWQPLRPVTGTDELTAETVSFGGGSRLSLNKCGQLTGTGGQWAPTGYVLVNTNTYMSQSHWCE